MNAKDLRDLLNKSEDKFNIFKDRSTLSKYSLTISELVDLVNNFLTDEERASLFNLDHFLNLSSNIKSRLIQSISDDSIKLRLINNDDIISEFKDYEIINIVESLGDDGKIEILHNSDFIEENNIKDFHIRKMIKSLNEENKKKVLCDKDFIENELHLPEYQIIDIVVSIEDEETKLDMMDIYDFNNALVSSILKTFSDESKEGIILDNSYGFNRFDLEDLISSFNSDSLVNFINHNKEFLNKNKISPYKITRKLDKERQIEFVSKLNDIELDIKEKRKILATLRQDTKNEIDISNFSDEYVTAIQIQTRDEKSDILLYGRIKVDFSKNPEIYRGLDELISVNPLQEVSDENKTKFYELCNICPGMSIEDNIGLSPSTVQEYKNAEAWIESVLQGIDAEWTDIQKLASIDNAIGKKISYSPDFDTEVSKDDEARALWKIVDSGYGVCNGIAQVEKYILEKVGIESEIVSGKRHSFLKIKEIQVPNAEGGVTRGDTILDPTWNLAAHRFGCFPNNFCKSYTEIRKHDIRASDGKDLECHRNDEDLASATLDLDEQVLRDVFKSLGLTDRDGNFPIKTLIDKSKDIDDCNLPTEQAIEKQLLLLSKYYPNFAKCQNSTMDILKNISLNQENLNFDKCVVNRVYERDDESKRPVLYVYIASQELGKKFYIPDTDTKQFTELLPEEFISKFECYEMDMEKQGGHRPWEEFEEKENLEDLARSSGTVATSEGEGR